MLREKMTTQLMAPDCHTPFKSLHDVIARLLPYHMWSEAEPPPGAIEKGERLCVKNTSDSPSALDLQLMQCMKVWPKC